MTEEKEATCAGADGATGGVATSVGAVAALGVPGLGATGITSGLAAVGSVVGGGMTTGRETLSLFPTFINLAQEEINYV